MMRLMTLWEYKVLEPNMKIRDRIEVMEREFNRAGAAGWELCSDHAGSYTFKRPLPDPQEGSSSPAKTALA